MRIIIGVVLWLTLGFIGSCGEYAYAQGRFTATAQKDRREDGAVAVTMALGGPLNLIAAFAATGAFEYGFKMPFTK